ncbi:diguanylate cyclase domain-containing protein [Mycobacterium bohemicum DSM 44277]|uniref:Diguanylate cyclase domain-containing protein n=1 Tax=Mycobacterium bohemicum DSM 44277 TaxID=1236609 RepID=A0A0U0WFM6_MYCBE|nr:GGDEF domain-containing protein [Mycobacterium bohemicum]MCV6969710.1 GGDEF domain-containing protein [Mycobacterium bohemicum]CPR13414.1 diguanylate cyclase domain-containing protein [Mycobacterium bohemicum DSM 44277]
MTWIRPFGGQPDQYQWLSGYLAERGLQRFAQLAIATFASLFGVVPIVMLWSPSGPKGTTGTAAAVAITLLCAAMAALWLSHWPTRHESELFALGCNVGVTIGCIVAGSPITGLLACTTFAPIGGYVALFHSSRLLTLTLANAALTTVFSAVRVALAGDPALAFGHFLGVAIAVLAVPFAGQVLLHLLTLDAMVSHTDPLTGLHNRRGFYRSVQALLPAKGPDEAGSFAVVMVDLDGFKRLNDHHGHAVGDEILTAVADNLRRASNVNSVVARLGGEEFLIAEVGDAAAARDTADRMLAAVAATPWAVTASVGVATTPLANADPQPALIKQMIAAADAAMYEAKHAGGNQVRCRGAQLTP